MKQVGIISDTHGYLDERFIPHLRDCDEVWHAGDIGSLEVADQISGLSVLKAVYGNIDGHSIRAEFTQVNRFICEDIDVMIKHIVGKPGSYDYSMKQYLFQNPPKLLIAGHSHILKIQNDPRLGFLFINPGAAGNSGFHKVKTMVKLTIDESNMKNCEVVELQR